MSARVAAPRRDGAWILAPAGLGLLLIRPLFAFGPGGLWLVAASYVLVGAASVLAMPSAQSGSAAGDLGPVPGVVVGGALALGLGAFALVAAGQQALHVAFGPVSLGLTDLASVAEEAFFRGFLFGRLVRFGPALAIVGSAVAFALIHVLAYPPAAVWVDLAAGLLFGWQRWVTGSWLVPAGTHLMANLLVVMA